MEQYEPILREIIKSAAIQAMQYYGSAELGVQQKGQDGPVTKADHASNKEICLRLFEAFPDHGILTEEVISEEQIGDRSLFLELEKRIQNWHSYEKVFMIDPLDGTKDFISRSGEFAIEIGLLVGDLPTIGMIYTPVNDTLYSAQIGDEYAWREEVAFNYVDRAPWSLSAIHTSKKTELKSLRFLVSPNTKDQLLTDFLEQYNLQDPIPMGSFAFKVCKIAENQGDVYIFFNPRSSLWDSCAAQVIIESAGGRMTYADGSTINYRGNQIKHEKTIVITNGFCHDQILSMLKEKS